MTNVAKNLGYAGSGVVDGVQVLITGGGFDKAVTPSYLNPLDISPTAVSRSRVLHADGVEAYSGSLSFDVTQNFLNILTTSKLFKRRYSFAVGFDDGEASKGLTNCYVTSLSINGAAGGLMSASISVVSASALATMVVANNYIGFQGSQGVNDNMPMGYWYSGNTNVKEWSLSMNQDASPVYGNKNVKTPQYIKIGLVSYTLTVTTYEQLYPYTPAPSGGTDAIYISTSSFTLKGAITSENSSYNGTGDLGGYVHTFESAADASTGSGDSIIT
jgi:hypothetical protein